VYIQGLVPSDLRTHNYDKEVFTEWNRHFTVMFGRTVERVA